MATSSDVPDRYAKAPDGFLARRNGRYAELKLAFLDDYLPAALVATQTMQRRWYIDLFAGPGWNVDKQASTYFFAGSPYRALCAHGPSRVNNSFTRAVFVNNDSTDSAELSKRIELWSRNGDIAVPRDRIMQFKENATTALARILNTLPKRDYAFIFADIEGITELPWASVVSMRAHGHRSIDLYVLFPLEMTLQRLLSYEANKRTRYGQTLTAFFGTDAWIALASAERTNAQGPEFRQHLIDLYVEQLRTLWKHVSVQATVYLTGDRPFYRMIFASNHPVGDRLAAWQRSEIRKSQIGLGF